MPTFICTVCESEFALSEETLQKYPNWKPKYCSKHSPRKKITNSSKKPSATQFEDLTTSEVLDKFSEGPQTGIFTDGGSRPNPGPGGWGVVKVKDGEIIVEKYGESREETTNNRMELTALIEGMRLVNLDEEVDIYTDSELCVNILTKWVKSWEKNGWKRKTGEIKNLELVKELYALYQERPKVNIQWIKAHNGWLWNEYVDSLASAWARKEL